MSQNMPTVSVLTPIYNTNPQHLRECIESVLNQTFSDFEFIILNDSPDNTALDDIVASYSDGRIRYVRNDVNMGISASRNRLLDMARGKYVAIFDHDDVCMPDRLEKSVAILDSKPWVGVVSGWMRFFDGPDADFIRQYPEHDLDIRTMLCQDCFVAHTASMIRKSVLDSHGIRYEAAFTPAEDYRLWARLMPYTHFYNIPSVLVHYRNHDARTSISQQSRMRACWRAISTDIRNSYPEYYRVLRQREDMNATTFRLRLFGLIPLVKIKNNRLMLFECIPICRIMWQ